MPIVITDDSTRADLEMAINHLNAKLQQTRDEDAREEIQFDIDNCLEAWQSRG